MRETRLVARAREWVVEHYPYNRDHLLCALDWLDRVAPGSSEAVRLATLAHDMERAFPGPDQPVATSLVDPTYEAAHAARSARIVGEWLRQEQADPALVADVERLVRAHEDGGWPDADLVQAADSLSFFETNVDRFLEFARTGRFPVDNVRRKFERMRDRIRLHAFGEVAAPLAARALERLDALAREVA